VELLKDACLAIGLIVLFDWLVAGRLAALAPSVTYRYWPLSKIRWITLVLFADSSAVSLDRPAEWTLPVLLLAFVVYGAAIMADLEQQRDRDDNGSRTPPRYSEQDADY
jgi:hypothetical protein